MCRATNETMESGEDPEVGDQTESEGSSSKRKRRVSFAPNKQHSYYCPNEQDTNGAKSSNRHHYQGKSVSSSNRCVALVAVLVISLGASLGVSTYARQALLSMTTRCGSGIDNGRGNLNTLKVLKQSSQASLSKNIFNETNKPIATFLFLVGVEGSGHHLWRSVYSASPSHRRYNKAQEKQNLAEPFIQMTRGLSSLFTAGCEGSETGGDDGDDSGSNRTRASVPALPTNSNMTQAFDDVVRGMRRIKGLLRKTYGSKHNTAVAINAFFRKMNRGKFFSYPFGQEDGCRTTSYPDLDVLYQACGEARVDCKHVLITRDAYEVIRSTTVNRHFSEVGQQIKTMSSMLDVMRIQNMDHHDRIAACWDFDAADGGSVDEVSELLGWESKDAFRATYSKLFRPPRTLGETERKTVVPPDLQELMTPYVQQTQRIADECRSLFEMKRDGTS